MGFRQKSGFGEKGREDDSEAMPGTGPRDRLLQARVATTKRASQQSSPLPTFI